MSENIDSGDRRATVMARMESSASQILSPAQLVLFNTKVRPRVDRLLTDQVTLGRMERATPERLSKYVLHEIEKLESQPLSPRNIPSQTQAPESSAQEIPQSQSRTVGVQAASAKPSNEEVIGYTVLSEDEFTNEDPEPAASDLGEAFYAKTKDATRQAGAALKIILTDPAGGQGEAWDLLGRKNAFLAGIVFNIGAIGVFLFVAWRMSSALPEGSSMFVSLALLSFVPSISIIITFLITSLVLRTGTRLEESVFSAGVVLLPLTALTLIGYLLGAINFEAVMLVGMVGIVFSILLVDSSLRHVHNLSPRGAFLSTPVIILVTAYIAKLVVGTMFQHLFALQ